jgi:hypothetical protein
MEESMRNAHILAFALSGSVLFFGSAAYAGPCTTEIDRLAQILSSKDAGSGPTKGAQAANMSSQARADQEAKAAGAQGSPGRAANPSAATRATSPQDVRRQTEGTGGENLTTGSVGSSPMDASASLDRARQLDRSGQESACMDAVTEAKRQLGTAQ